MNSFTAQVTAAIERIRPSIGLHDGDIELLSADEATGVVTVRLQGNCVGCPMSDITLTAGVESYLKEQVPGVTRVTTPEAAL